MPGDRHKETILLGEMRSLSQAYCSKDKHDLIGTYSETSRDSQEKNFPEISTLLLVPNNWLHRGPFCAII